ncbi:hypothetical protein GQ651_15145 [Alphaproteobacteria bacterium GH1-50]|uniref:Uncharacterized protein n=1 Tax=Kangsaoukella pontilimi TaxID=2691042 RepID=A0A7C9IJX8_9RHOB|nr:hypothetical protein [Kangsaoukella pontilimi]MXQ09182.1 hypothetical protein [Kangsaoukella pontilimi]
MSVSTPLILFLLYASPFLVAAIVLIRFRIARRNAHHVAEIDEDAFFDEDDMFNEVEAPAPRRYISYSAPSC